MNGKASIKGRAEIVQNNRVNCSFQCFLFLALQLLFGLIAIKHLNAWIDCVMETKDTATWSPDLSWTFAENLNKSASYILYNKISPLVAINAAEPGES